MPLPIAHGLIGMSIIAAAHPSRPNQSAVRCYLAGAALAICPDLDFILTWFLQYEAHWHRGFSHSMVFAVVVAVVAAVVTHRLQLKFVVLYGLAALSHGLCDTLVSVREGVQLLWPFSSYRFSLGIYEYPDVLTIYYQPSPDILMISGLKPMLRLGMIELIVFLPISILLMLRVRVLSKGMAFFRRDDNLLTP